MNLISASSAMIAVVKPNAATQESSVTFDSGFCGPQAVIPESKTEKCVVYS